jgi:hypothetical protein
VTCGPVRTRLWAAIASLLIAGAMGTALDEEEPDNSA